MDEDLLALLEQAEDVVAEEVSAVLAEVAEEFADSLAEADEIVAARFSVSRIAAMFTARMPRILRRLLRVSEQAAEHTAEAVDAELPPEWQDLPERHDDGRDLPPAMSEYVDVTEHLLRAVGDRLAEVAREELAAGVDAGESMEQLRARLRARFAREGAQLGEVREERIARTESGRAWNTAALGAARDVTGPDRPVVKQWISRRDARVRDDHADANGQIRLIDEQFTVGTVQMDAPHDPTAPAGQVVNCRCVLAVYPETAPTASDSQVAPSAAVAKRRETFMSSDALLQFHGTQGRPSYRKYHPKSGASRASRRTQHANGGWLGSDRFTEDQHYRELRWYTGSGYRDINDGLRTGEYQEHKRDELLHAVSAISDLINIQDPTAEDLTLYRKAENMRQAFNVGDEFHDRGFLSTSAREEPVSVRQSPDDPNYTFYKINVPRGAQVLSVDGVGGGNEEEEFILPPGTKFRVTGVVSSGDPTAPPTYELEVINAVVSSGHTGPPATPRSATLAAATGSSDFETRITWQPDDVVVDKRAKASGGGEATAAADGSHLTGGMIALMPTESDAARLALDGGEAAEELHLTLYFLGDNGGAWTDDQRNELAANVRAAVSDLPSQLTARMFGANHWNPASDSPSWVWAVGDDRDRPDGTPTLEEVRQLVTGALEDTHETPDVPDQHSPWVPHVCAQYSDDHGLLPALVDRLGDVTFDRIRLAFAGDHIDIPLGPHQEEPMTEDVQAAADIAEDFVPLTVRGWTTPEPWAIAYEDEETGDGRIFTKGAVKWDRQPKPLQYADEMLMGHQGARLAGAMQKVKRVGNRITSSGVLYLNQPAGLDAMLLLDEEAPLGISVDLDDVDLEFVDKTLSPEDADWLFASAHLPEASLLRMEDGSVMLTASTAPEWTASGDSLARSRYDLQFITAPNGAVQSDALRAAFAGTRVVTAAAGDTDDKETGLVVHSQKSGEFLLRITRARLRGATLVSMPAFKDAKIVLDPLEQSAAALTPTITAAGETRERVITYVCTSPAAVGARDVSTALGIAMSTARGHLNAAAKDGAIIRLAPGMFCGPSSMPEGLEEVTAAASGKLDLPVHAEQDAEWDGDKASSRVLDWATGDDGNVDADKLGQAFLWRDPDADPATSSAYKLGFADVFDNDGSPRLEIVANAVYTIASVLQGGMGGVDVPDADRDDLRARVEKLYARLADAYGDDSIEVPWTDDDQDDDEETASLRLPPDIEASAWTAMQQMPPMPAAWFREPTEEELPDGSGGVHVVDGRAYGWVAQMDEPHAGYPGKNLTLRKLLRDGMDFTHFLRAKGQLDDGSTVRIGAMTMNVGHHRDGAECETASCQFDDTRTVGAVVTVGLNDRGMWFSGAAAPWLSEWDQQVFAACQPSYHLKQGRDGKWQLRAVLTVPQPGHSSPLVAAIHAVAERSQLALAASAAGPIPLPGAESGHGPDAIRTASVASADTSPELPGQRPDSASGRNPDVVASAEDALLSDAFVDRFLDRVAERDAARRAEVAALQASLALTPVALTASAAPNGAN
ncbi:ADP-ribosyltransferase [Streptomyces sp. ME02-6987-2C]|uniref:ADP-ribosyltransferase n=1 Tax=unclassified Streptomyces TaxID=2593676 RepID=UPI0029AE283C|nr:MULTISPECIES: ADP-ribosyltransferase [unclassified Streptomyces]MDX3345893.1 ADP-ribosyltransferase [Streptomyces sp. ME02-6979A]MDX3365088.1 ADP-ribosyltransferase [Streptomyces sp. ME02-6987-2C]MDX3404857.1 ADP-ribosyltransferase [Streptomyces sp. ME02-6977A]MDX3421659.1 ADP-ribosyltransferase [Streptomyces sp. ME02-6985-2c]